MDTISIILLICAILGIVVLITLIRMESKKQKYPVPHFNFPVRVPSGSIPGVEGGIYYVSRSCAAEAVVLIKLDRWYVLANKRGEGCFGNVGLWNVPSGYADYGERLEHTAERETFEETGVCIDGTSLKLFELDSLPKDRQNIVAVYYTVLDPKKYGFFLPAVSNEFCEKNEVEEIKWIPSDELDDYEWISQDHIGRVKRIITMLNAEDIYNNNK